MGFPYSLLWNLLKETPTRIKRWWGTQEPSEKVQLRLKWKEEFQKHQSILRGSDLIIRHTQRVDNYPSTDDDGKGISSWFKAEYWGLYHRGIEVIIGVECVRRIEKEWILCHHKDQGNIVALVVGRIPFNVISGVDWSGDEYYPSPHIYCEFPRSQRKEPYEEVLLCEHRKGHPIDFLVVLDNYQTTLARSRHLGTHA